MLQHSGANRVTLSAVVRNGHIEVSLIDNGRGWDGEGEGAGLQTMRARASVVGAQLSVNSSPGQGTELRVTLPLQADTQLDLSSAA